MSKPAKPCTYPGCRELTNTGRCEQHKRKAWTGGKETPRMTGRKLQKFREILFNEQPLCVECLKLDRVSVATIRDHIIPLAEGGEDIPENTQPLCQACSDAKTKEESKRGRRNAM